MKEFASQDGGRYTFVDDVMNLQELALAINSIFHDCDNFVVWGCELSGDTVGEGYVYINGKLRCFSGGTCAANAQGVRYLFEHNTTETVPYASGDGKIGRKVYGVSLSDTVPVQDSITSSSPQFITITADGKCRRFKDAFIGQYALLLDAASQYQKVKGQVDFTDKVNLQNDLLLAGPVIMEANGVTVKLFIDGSSYKIQTMIGVHSYTIESSATGITVYSGSQPLLSFSDDKIQCHKLLVAPQMQSGVMVFHHDTIYNEIESIGVLEINRYSGKYTTDYFRTTNIGNGKGDIMLAINGSIDTITATVTHFIFRGDNTSDLVLICEESQNNPTYAKKVIWKDRLAKEVGHIGYDSLENNDFAIINQIGNVKIVGIESVDIAPTIKENGVLLKDRYALKTDMTAALKDKADVLDVYTKEDAIAKFADLKNGLGQFINNTTDAAALRRQIEAISTTDLAGYVQKEQYLADMAVTEADKLQIRQNIGAAAAGDFEPKLKDTGWKPIGGTGLYARQIGNIVSIQGITKNTHTDTIAFTLPNGIDSPAYTVGYSWNVSMNGTWSCRLAAYTRDAIVTYCNAHGVTIPISITYFV